MKKIILYILLVVIVVSVLGVASYFYISKITNEEKEVTKEQEQIKELPVVTLDKMQEIAKNEELMIDLELVQEIEVEQDIKLVLNDGNLFLVDNKNHKSKIKGFDEKVIAIHSAFNSCVADFADILILTEKGNLFVFKELIIYNDNTVSFKNENLLKTKLGDNLIIKEYLIVKNEIIYILGKDNLLYMIDINNNFSWKDTRVRELKKINENIVEIYFVDGSNMKINLQGNIENNGDILNSDEKKAINQKLEMLYYPLREILNIEQETEGQEIKISNLNFNLNYLDNDTLLFKFIWTLCLDSSTPSRIVNEDEFGREHTGAVSYLFSNFKNYYKKLTNKEFLIDKLDRSLLLIDEIPRLVGDRIYGSYVTGWGNNILALKVKNIEQNEIELVLKADVLISYNYEDNIYFDYKVLDYPSELKKADVEIKFLKIDGNYVIKSIVLD